MSVIACPIWGFILSACIGKQWGKSLKQKRNEWKIKEGNGKWECKNNHNNEEQFEKKILKKDPNLNQKLGGETKYENQKKAMVRKVCFTFYSFKGSTFSPCFQTTKTRKILQKKVQKCGNFPQYGPKNWQIYGLIWCAFQLGPALRPGKIFLGWRPKIGAGWLALQPTPPPRGEGCEVAAKP